MATLEEMQARYRETLDELGAARKARRWALVKAINVERYALRGSIARVMEIEKDFATVQVDSLAVHLADAENEVRHLKQANLDLLEALRRVVNGATRTMGRNSIGQEYAHISQDVLDVGRDMLHMAGIPNVSERS